MDNSTITSSSINLNEEPSPNIPESSREISKPTHPETRKQETIKQNTNSIDTFQPPEDPEEGNTSATMAAIQIGNTILGAGIISLPVVLRYLGLILGTVFIIATGIMTIYSVVLLIKAHEITKKNKYSDIAREGTGDLGYLFITFMIVFSNFGLCCAYLRIFGENMQNTIIGYVHEDHYWVTNWHNYLYIVFLFILMSFVIVADSFESFEKTSFLGIIGIITYFIGLFVLFFYKLSKGLLPSMSWAWLLPNGPFLDLLTSLPPVFLSYAFQFNLFPIYFTMKNRNQIMASSTSAIIFCLVLYTLSAICGHLMYGKDLTDTTLKMLLLDMKTYKDSDSFIKIVLVITNIGFLCCSTTGIPLMFCSLKRNLFDFIRYYLIKLEDNVVDRDRDKDVRKPMVGQSLNSTEIKHNSDIENEPNKEGLRDSTLGKSAPDESCTTNPIDKNVNPNSNENENIIVRKVDLSSRSKLIISAVVYWLIGVTTIVIPQIKTIFNVVGATAANSISFILPGLIIIQWNRKNKTDFNMWYPYLWFIFGIIIWIACMTAEIIIAFK